MKNISLLCVCLPMSLGIASLNMGHLINFLVNKLNPKFYYKYNNAIAHQNAFFNFIFPLITCKGVYYLNTAEQMTLCRHCALL